MTVILNGVQAVHPSTESYVYWPIYRFRRVVHDVSAKQNGPSDTFLKDGPWAKKDWEPLIYDYLVISETRTTSNKPEETIRQMDN